ncbi:hypothetical protein [Bacillus sp. JJ1764]|uniref:hypothetical protein n=1 Tax=Bacillus sp. JJ1764 TaxID=3122964 RepID=UPI002FFF7752
MSIMKSKYLNEKITNCNLIPLEVSDFDISNRLYLNIDKIDDFLKYASDSNSKYVYYHYTYYNSEEYIIPTDWYSEYSKEFKTEVRAHNQRIKSLDFDSPKSLTLFILQNGTFVGVEIDNTWLQNQGIMIADVTIDIIENQFYREVKKFDVAKKEQYKEDENELREIIFNDPEFKFCKNQELRYWYLVELLEKEDMKKYDYMLQSPGIPHMGKIKMFMDKTWELYKERNK